jgi:DNA-directed RNA polymerase subunit beta
MARNGSSSATSPFAGVYFDTDQSKTTIGEVCRTRPRHTLSRSWLDFEFDHKELVYVRIDKKKKIPVTLFLKALGYSEKEILDYFTRKRRSL